VRDGKVVLVGDEADVEAVTGSQTRVVQAGGGMVMPGLSDVHSHVGFGGQSAAWELRISSMSGVEEILRAVRDRAGELGRDEWVVGGIVISPVFHAMGSLEMLAALDELSLALDLDTAVRAHTVNAAQAMGLARQTGQICHRGGSPGVADYQDAIHHRVTTTDPG
jgi:predicted amidohydrolase YtcJ